jgi:hypothetical protein
VLSLAALSALWLKVCGTDLLMQQMQLAPFFLQTDVAVVRLLALAYLPELMDILPMYIFMLAWLALLHAACGARWYFLLPISIAVYAVASATGINLPDFPTGSDGSSIPSPGSSCSRSALSWDSAGARRCSIRRCASLC